GWRYGPKQPYSCPIIGSPGCVSDRQIACIISLGTGQPHTIKFPTILLKRFSLLTSSRQSRDS
ncbi:hypothetical protein B0H13DRAFT_1720434, partial [Mycena leptocephala]